MRLAEIRNGFFGFLARVFDSWASFLRPPVEPVRKDPFVSAGPPAHWLELTAGLTFTEFGAEAAGEPGVPPIETGAETGAGTGAPGGASNEPEAGKNETRASRPQEDSRPQEVEEAFVKKTRPPVPGNKNAASEPPRKKTAGARPVFSFAEVREKPGEELPAFSPTPEKGGRRFPSESFAGPGEQKKPESFSGETKFYSPEKNVAGDAGQESRIVPVFSEERQAVMESMPAQKISGRRVNDAFEAHAPREVRAPGKNGSVSDRAFVEAGERSQMPGVVFPPGRNNSEPPLTAENFPARAAERFPEIRTTVPAKISAPADAAAFPETAGQARQQPQYASVFPAARGRENDFGRGFVGRGEKAKDLPGQPIMSNASKWGELPELELGGADGMDEADHLRLKHLAELEREQKGERWSV